MFDPPPELIISKITIKENDNNKNWKESNVKKLDFIGLSFKFSQIKIIRRTEIKIIYIYSLGSLAIQYRVNIGKIGKSIWRWIKKSLGLSTFLGKKMVNKTKIIIDSNSFSILIEMPKFCPPNTGEIL